MQKEYYITKILNNHLSDKIWDSIPSVLIDCYPWDENLYKPNTEVKLFYTDTHFHLNFKTRENAIKATYLEHFQPVYKDSCVEFFFKPNPQYDNRYLNFEINPFGKLLLGFGKDRFDRQLLKETNCEIFNIVPSITTEIQENDTSVVCWNIKYSIPFIFLEKYYGKLELKTGSIIYGNFYKCGDETPYPHFGCWNPINSPIPDFHRPECFGRLILK